MAARGQPPVHLSPSSGVMTHEGLPEPPDATDLKAGPEGTARRYKTRALFDRKRHRLATPDSAGRMATWAQRHFV